MADETQEIVPDPPDLNKTYEEPASRVTPGVGTPSGRPVALVRTRANDETDDGIFIRDGSGNYHRFTVGQLASAQAMIQAYLER